MAGRIQSSRKGVENISNCDHVLESRPYAVQWLVTLLFPALSSFMFACLLEWDRYQVIIGPNASMMTISDKILLFWLLTAKSMAWFLPFLLICGILMRYGLSRCATVALNIFWIAIFYFMAFDLVSVNFAGYHVWDYLPNIWDILENPDLKIWQWAGERLTTEALLVLAVFVISGPVCYVSIKWITKSLTRRFRWLVSQPTPAIATLTFLFYVLAMVPAFDFFPERICATLPLTPGAKESLQRFSETVATRMGLAQMQSLTAGFIPALNSVTQGENKRLALLTNTSLQDMESIDATLDDAAGLTGIADSQNRNRIPLTKKIAHLNRFFSSNPNISRSGDLFAPRLDSLDARVESEQPRRDPMADPGIGVTRRDEESATRMLRESLDPGPADSRAFVAKQGLPNVILIIFESFRHCAISPNLMAELDSWSEQGLRLQRHYSGSNCSHLGLFSLFYGRAPLGYHQTLDRKIPAQMLQSLRQSGYEITFLTSGETKGFRRLDQFINPGSCDNYVQEGEFTLQGMMDWPDSDRRKLADVQNIVNRPQKRPQFVFFYLVSSHYRYSFPPEFDIFKESPSIWEFLTPRAQIQNHMNRYSNAALFLEHEVMKTLRSIDPRRNLVIMTGDHGESIGEDGVFTHGSRMSEIQMRVPFVMVGPGVKPRTITTATGHADVLPTLLHALAGRNVPVRNTHGRDLMADPAPADEIAVVPANGPNWDGLMIIRGDRRMIFRTGTTPGQGPVMRFDGLADESGHYELKVKRSRHASGPDR